MTMAAEPAWQITPEKIQVVVQRLIQIAGPKKIILFGSYVRGDATRDSDLDVLVVTSYEVESPRRESVRLRNSLSDINMPMDIIVVPCSRCEALREKTASFIERRTAAARSYTRARNRPRRRIPSLEPFSVGEQHFMALEAMEDHTRNGTLS